jgi:hypothetical protein
MLAGGCTLDFVEFVYHRLDLKYSLVKHLNVADYFKTTRRLLKEDIQLSELYLIHLNPFSRFYLVARICSLHGPPPVLSMLETTKISERFGVLDLDYRRLLQDG